MIDLKYIIPAIYDNKSLYGNYHICVSYNAYCYVKNIGGFYVGYSNNSVLIKSFEFCSNYKDALRFNSINEAENALIIPLEKCLRDSEIKFADTKNDMHKKLFTLFKVISEDDIIIRDIIE